MTKKKQKLPDIPETVEDESTDDSQEPQEWVNEPIGKHKFDPDRIRQAAVGMEYVDF